MNPEWTHMRNPYSSPKDIQDRLGHTYIRYKGEIFFVEVACEDDDEAPILILCDPLGDKKPEKVPPDDPDLDVSAFELGYMNLKSGGVIYLTKGPIKQWKQGFVPQRTRGWDISGKSRSIPHIQEYLESLSGKYPDIQGVMSGVGPKDVALSPQVAIQRTLSGVCLIYLNCKNVAHLEPTTKKIHIKDGNFKWAYGRILKPVFGGQYGIEADLE